MKTLKACMAIAAACTFSASAASNLELIQQSANHERFMDMDSIEHNGDIAQFWVITDFKEVQIVAGTRFSSTRSLEEYNCRTVKGRVAFVAAYEKHAGAGDSAFHSTTNLEMMPVAPGTTGADAFEKACNKAIQ